jgi:HlyD family secretion protein
MHGVKFYGPVLAAFVVTACKAPPPLPPYLTVPVQKQDIVVSSLAAGTIQPDTIIEVKSKASGEILEVLATTGQTVRRGDLLVRVDPRLSRNAVEQAQAALDAANASLLNATLAKQRAETLLAARVMTKADRDQAVLEYATARATAVNDSVALDNVMIQLQDTDIRAPASGTIIEQDVERGQIIASATFNVGGGSVLLKMADLGLMQVLTLVDETDIGKIKPGLDATVTVDAFPNRLFKGTVLKIEPSAQIQQNVTMFPVRIRVDNSERLVQTGMNCEVEIHVGERHDVLAIPFAALRTQKDVGSAAQVLGLSPQEVQASLAQPAADADQRPGARAVLLAGGGGGGAASDKRFGGDYIVFVLRSGKPLAVRVRTGITNLDQVEVVSGLNAQDTVLVLPTAGLVQQQAQMQQRVQSMTGGGLPGVRQKQPGAAQATKSP